MASGPIVHVCMLTQSYLTLCNPMDYSRLGSSVHGIFQARILEWVSISCCRDLPDPGIEPHLPFWHWQADFLPLCHPGIHLHQFMTNRRGKG